MLKRLFRGFRKANAADTGFVPVSPPKGKVLVVDDDAVVRKTLNIKLGSAGFQVFEAGDGATALSLARQETPDVIIMDIHLVPEPGITWDGFSLMRWLSHSYGGVRSPTVVITADTSVNLREKALAAGAADFFQKPLDLPVLLATLNKLISAAARSTG